jgi:hypothetical protein
MRGFWFRLRLLFSLDPAAGNLTLDQVAVRTEGRVRKFILGLYYAGYDPTDIARVLIAHGIALVEECGGPGVDYSQLSEAHAVMDRLLITENARRGVTPPYDRVARFVRRKEFRGV